MSISNISLNLPTPMRNHLSHTLMFYNMVFFIFSSCGLFYTSSYLSPFQELELIDTMAKVTCYDLSFFRTKMAMALVGVLILPLRFGKMICFIYLYILCLGSIYRPT